MNYKIRRQITNDEQANLAPFSALVSHLIFHRGITTAETALKFLEPDYDRDINNPFLFKDMEKAAERIVLAIENGEKIAIYADYDADGIPGAAMWNDFFGRIGYKNFVIYIPHRHDEGFGLNNDAVTALADEGVKLLVTLDCGIADQGPVDQANSLGLEVIITDHHEPPDILPKAYAIVDHKQKDCQYPDKNLCGTAVGFKLIQGILAKNRFGMKEGMEKWLLDLVGMATLSDMVNLVGENRVFAKYGLEVLRKTPRKGLNKLFQKLKMQQRFVTEDDIAFMITPRINAASRMGVPMDAFKMLAATGDEEADMAAEHLDGINNERKGVVAALVKEIKKHIHERYDLGNNGTGIPSVIVMGNPDWRPALLGLAANTCAEEFDRPVFLWGRDGDNALKGSCRSEGRTHVVELMKGVPSGVFTQFGGHHHSGGFAVAKDAVHFLEQHLNEVAKKMATESVTEEIATSDKDMIDAEISLDGISYEFYNEINKLAPFGVGNPKPIFLLRNIRPIEVRVFGKTKEHMELIFKKTAGQKVSAISFFGVAEKWARDVAVNKPLDMVASIEKSMFKGRPELRLRVVEVVT